MRVLRFDSGAAEYFNDDIVEDVLVKINVNGVQKAEVMAFEEHLDELVLGHLKNSNVINALDEIESLVWDDFIADVWLTHGFDSVVQRVRWSGVLDNAHRGEEIEFVGNDGLSVISPDQVLHAMGLLNESCEVFKRTGGTHSALIINEDLEYVFAEDVGRFNALDKVVGLTMRAGLDLGESMLVTSGRLSGEMVLKAAFAGIPVMCSVSAPMRSGVCIAKAADMTLIGFVRGERFNVYSGFRRISS